jgi:hypothetical protein
LPSGDEHLDIVQLMPTRIVTRHELSLELLSAVGLSDEHCDSDQVATLHLL